MPGRRNHPMTAELATYQLQICCGFTLDDAPQLQSNQLQSPPLSIKCIRTGAAAEEASEYQVLSTDALARLPSAPASDWASLRRRHLDKGILLNLPTTTRGVRNACR